MNACPHVPPGRTYARYCDCESCAAVRALAYRLAAPAPVLRLCDEPGCLTRHHARGFCRAHYTAWRRANDPTYVKSRRAPRDRTIGVDPIAVEMLMRGPVPSARTSERTAAVDVLVQRPGMSAAEIAERVGVSKRTVSRRRARARRLAAKSGSSA